MMKKTAAAAVLLCLSLVGSPLTAQEEAKVIDRIAAVVENDLITENELRMQLGYTLAALRRQDKRDIDERELLVQVMQQMIMQKLQLQEAEKRGIRVDEETLDRTLENMAERNQLSLAQMKEKIEEGGGDYGRFREDIRKEIIITRLLQQEVVNKIEVSEREIENYLEQRGHYENRRWRLVYLQFMPQRDSAELKERALAVYKAMRDQTIASPRRFEKVFQQEWRALFGGETALPDYRMRTVHWRKEQWPKSQRARMEQMEAEKSGWLMNNSQGTFIFRLLAAEGGGDQIIETQFLSQHILMLPTPLDKDEHLEKKLAAIKSRIEKGGDFAEYARRYSKDPGSASKGGRLGWLSAGQVVPEFAKALQIGKDRGGIVGPFKTQYGWHILEVLDVREKNVTDSVLRGEAVAGLRKAKTEKEKKRWLLELRENSKVEIRL